MIDLSLTAHFVPVLALYPSSGTSPAILSHPYGSYEAPTVSSASPEEILFWCLIPARASCCATSTEAHKKESQGTVIFLCVWSLLWLYLHSRSVWCAVFLTLVFFTSTDERARASGFWWGWNVLHAHTTGPNWQGWRSHPCRIQWRKCPFNDAGWHGNKD